MHTFCGCFKALFPEHDTFRYTYHLSAIVKLWSSLCKLAVIDCTSISLFALLSRKTPDNFRDSQLYCNHFRLTNRTFYPTSKFLTCSISQMCLSWFDLLGMGREHCRKKEKIWVISIYFISHNVFKSFPLQGFKNKGLFGKGLILKCLRNVGRKLLGRKLAYLRMINDPATRQKP